MNFPGPARFGLRFSDASWLGSVRFGSVPRLVPAGSGMKRFGSVWFGRFGSVSHFLPVRLAVASDEVHYEAREWDSRPIMSRAANATLGWYGTSVGQGQRWS